MPGETSGNEDTPSLMQAAVWELVARSSHVGKASEMAVVGSDDSLRGSEKTVKYHLLHTTRQWLS